ncbi:hypothetical protein GF314_11775 [bacterium]|nr:hypothetical protein [bacterium]
MPPAPSRRPSAILLIAVLVAAGCGDESDPTAPADQPRDPATLPLLPEGSHPSLVVAFEALPAATAAAAEARWDEAIDAGMAVGRVHLDWASVEPDSGVVDVEILREELARLSDDGLAPLVAIMAMDTEGATLPADLQARFEGGLAMDAPAILDRYRAMLDWTVPIIVEHGGWGLVVANENDGYLIENPDQVEAVARFYRAAREHTRGLAPELAVTATHTMDGPLGGAPHYATLIAELDVASFNYYPLDHVTLELLPPTAALIDDHLVRILDAAAGKLVILQELGCPAGYPVDSALGATPAIQQEFFRLAFARLAAEPRLRAAFVFQMVDWSPDLFQMVYGDFLDAIDLPQDFVDRFEEWLLTTGLMTYDEGEVRPAWSTFLDALDPGSPDPR